ncbi:MAG: hypothetical protein JO142_01625 [Burkholderiales bacterium]|nr:hypothetical protein [Burkholderiales bacterium]
MTIALHVPEPIAGRNLPVETNPKAVKSWLVSLPPANLAETARSIFDALTTLNRVKLDDEARLKLLEHYQVAVDLLDAPLEAVYTSASLPAKEKAKQAAVLARNLQLELANGYKLVLLDRLATRFSFGNRQIPELIRLLMLTYQKLMWVCCKSYSAIPAGVWAEVHALFHYAIQHKLIDTPEGLSPMKTIGGIYKQILLLALADPYRYHPAEHEKIQDLIKNYGAAAQFQPLGNTPNPAGFFLVRLESDVPPAFLGQKPFDVQASTAILLDTMEMAKHLHKALQSVEQKAPHASDKAKAQAWIDLLRRVTRQWSIAPKRVFQRIRASSRVRVVGSLRLTAYYLNGATPLLQPVVLSDTVVDGEGPVSVSGGVYAQPDEWVVLNESPGGYALRMAPVPQHCVYRVGDVVGLQSEANQPWLVATVRWLQTLDDGEALEIGVQILAPKAEPAMLRPTLVSQEASFAPCLLLEEVPAIKQPPLIVAARGTYGSMRELVIYSDAGEHIVRCGKSHELAIGYELFEFVSSTH